MRPTAGLAPAHSHRLGRPTMAAWRIAHKRLAVAAGGVAMAVFGVSAWANQTLAADLGCYNCHGNPPRQEAPSFPELAAQYAPARNDPALQARLAEKLRKGSTFGRIVAHERISAEAAAQLVRWIAEGAP